LRNDSQIKKYLYLTVLVVHLLKLPHESMQCLSVSDAEQAFLAQIILDLDLEGLNPLHFDTATILWYLRKIR
jgi:hypothetical protein